MSRYIDANLISYEQRDRLGLGIDYGTTDKSTYEIAYKSQIDKIPTVDVEEVRHGKWIENPTMSDLYSKYYNCNLCTSSVRIPNGYRLENIAPYCHCGAKMHGGKE